MKTRLLSLPLLLALVASLAACGGGSTVVPASAVAIVNGTPITVAQYNEFFTQAIATMTAQGQPKPTAGSPQYQTLRAQVIAYLVQFEELKQQAKKEGVKVTDADVTKFLTDLAKTRFNGSMKQLEAALKKQGITMTTAKQEVEFNLLGQKLRTKVTSTAKVSQSQAKSYYTTNIAQFSVPTRDVAHILVKTKSLADSIEKKLQQGASFSALAKQYSVDTGSAQHGGQLCIAKTGQAGPCIQTVPPFAKAAFALKTHEISAPVHSQFGWHIITALGPVENPATFSMVQSWIRQQLSSTAQQKLWQQWLTDLQKNEKVTYQSGYQPPTTTALPTTNGTPQSPPPATTG